MKALWNGLIVGMMVVGTFTMPAAAATDASKDDAARALKELNTANNAEISIGKMAARKGQSPEVKAFGKQLVEDHSKSNEQVRQVAEKMGVSLETVPAGGEITAEKKDTKEGVSDLSKVSGKEFDKKFAKMMVEDHQKDIETLRSEEKKLTGTPTGDLIAQTIPVMQQHLQTAQRLKDTTKQES